MPTISAIVRKAGFCMVAALTLLMPLQQSEAQSSSASISVSISDATRAAIPDATLILRNTDTNQEQHTKTRKTGNADFPFLKPGRYALSVSKPQFSEISVDNIVLNIGDQKTLALVLTVGPTSQTVTVDASGSTVNTTDASVSTVIDRKFVANIPLNGRSFQDLVSMTPGVVTQSPQAGTAIASSGDFSINGQRTESNYYTVDGIAGNSLTGNGYGSQGAGASGSLPAATALGTTQSLVSIDALQEFRLQSSTYSAEYGRNPGGQISLVTRSGTNDFHGSAFDYLRNNFFDANDWFNNYYGKPISPLRQNNFGGTLGGPITIPLVYNGKNKSFFFASYEGLRLTQPQAASIQYVPDTYMRQQAPQPIQSILNGFPVQNGFDYGSASSPSLAQFIGTYSLPSKIDSTSIRLDQEVGPHLSLFFRYGFTPSSTKTRRLSSLSTASISSHTYTVGATSAISPGIGNDFRLGYLQSDSIRNGTLDSFGGGTPLDLLPAMAQGTSTSGYPLVLLNFAGIGNTGLYYANDASNGGRQWNVTDTLTATRGRHHFKFGVDYRKIKSPAVPSAFQAQVLFFSAKSILTNTANTAIATKSLPVTPIYNETSIFAQDEWKVSDRVSLSLGLRWEVDPPPTEAHGNDAYTLIGSISDPQSLQLAPRGTPLWKASWFNFAPRLGVAWIANATPNWETVLRSGGGVFFDTNNQNATQGYGGLGMSSYKQYSGASLPLVTSQVDFPIAVSEPYNDVYAYPLHLQAPYTLEWNVSLQQSLGRPQSFTVSYVGANGRRLVAEQLLDLSGANPKFGTVAYPISGITSNYHALQLKFQRTVAKGLQALTSYTWSHSIDFGSNALALPLTRGNSDFDVRSNFAGGVSYDIPTPGTNDLLNKLVGHWGADARLTARTAFPVTLEGNYLINPANGSGYYGNLDLLPNIPIYVHGNQYPGGRAINPAAFAYPVGDGTGNAPRNFVRGFGAAQLNLAFRREFPVHDRLSLQFRAESFNVLNHATFGYIDPYLGDATFGQATKMLNQSLGTLASQYQQGGPRSMQFALKVMF